MDLSLEAGDQFAVAGHQRMLGFDLGHDGLLRGDGWAKGSIYPSLGQRPRNGRKEKQGLKARPIAQSQT